MIKNPEYCWVDTAFNGVNNRNKIMNISNIKIMPNMKDCYRTIFRFKEDFNQYVKETGSIKGYRGSAFADYFPIDIDDGDLDISLIVARNVLNKLEANYDVDLDQLRVYFSGNKGFHIIIPEPMIGLYASPKLPYAFKLMAKEILKGIKYDPTIYEHTRLFRLTNTINSKSGLYKVPLTINEIMNCSINDIRKMAQSPRKIQECPFDEVIVNRNLQELFLKCMQELKNDDVSAGNSKMSTIPKDAKLCYYKLLEGVKEGERDNAALRLATFFRKQGYPSDITYGMLKAWNKHNTPPLQDTEMDKFVHQAYENNYDYGCKDFLLEKYCSDNCYLKHKKTARVSDDKIYTVDDLQRLYEGYVNELDTRKITLGINEIDKRLRGIAPGEVMQIIARSAVGKTAFLLNIIKNISKTQNSPILFFSLEMPGAQIYERIVQISGKFTGEEVEEAFHTKAANKEVMARLAKEGYSNMYTVDQDCLTLDELIAYTELTEAKIGRRIEVICIDYLGRMNGGRGDEYEVVSGLAKQLKTLAKETDRAVICLHQTNRQGGTGAEPITMNMGRGTGVFEEAADHIIGLWRPEIDNPESQASDVEPLMVAILKGRKGPKCQHEMCLNKPKLIISEWDTTQDDEPF